MSEIQQNTNKLLEFIGNKFETGNLDNDSLVQIIELCGGYLNLSTVADFAKANNLSYNGAKNYREVIELFKVKFVIENE